METLFEFFKMVKSRLNFPDAEDIGGDTDNIPYLFIYDMDTFILYQYAYKIADNLPPLSKDQIRNYARCLLGEFKNLFQITFSETTQIKEKRIRVFKDESKTSYTPYSLEEAKEKHITGEEYEEIYCFRTIFGKQKDEVDIYPLMTDCYGFIYILREIFSKYEIDLKVEAQEMELGFEYFNEWEDIKSIKKEIPNRKYNNRIITEAAHILAVETILSELGIKINENKTAVVDFFNFITGRNMTTKQGGTNVYKRIGQANKNYKNYNNDCDVVADIFDRIGLNHLANKVISGKKDKDEEN